MHRFLALTPALLVLSLSNGLQEELLQAVIFTIAHAGITYTPTALLFLIVVVFPLGLITGYLMRTN